MPPASIYFKTTKRVKNQQIVWLTENTKLRASKGPKRGPQKFDIVKRFRLCLFSSFTTRIATQRVEQLFSNE